MELVPACFPFLSPSPLVLSSFDSQEKSIWPRCVSESDVDTVGKAWKVWCVVLSGAPTKFLYYASVSEERGTGPLWLECTPIHSPDLNLSFNRPCTHGNVRFIFCTNFRLLYSGSSSLLSIEYRFNTARFLDCDPCVLNPLFLDIRANFVQGNFSCYIISRSWSYFYPGIHPLSRNSLELRKY